MIGVYMKDMIDKWFIISGYFYDREFWNKSIIIASNIPCVCRTHPPE